jgi:hypothetical protein
MYTFFQEQEAKMRAKSLCGVTRSRPCPTTSPLIGAILSFQRTVGNRVVRHALHTDHTGEGRAGKRGALTARGTAGAPNSPAIQREEARGARRAAPSIVYLCSKDLDTSPIGSHAFFRIGAPGRGAPTLSLQPVDASLGADCWQGMPGRNYPSDVNADADCEPTPISVSCLEREYRAYPVGHYCTFGPNSNTFVGVLARNCGVSDPDPSGWTPGIGDAPPPSGTYAPDKWTTLTGCSTKRCIIGPEDPGSDTRPA